MTCPTRGVRLIVDNVGDQTFFGDYASFAVDYYLLQSLRDQLGDEADVPLVDPIRGDYNQVEHIKGYVAQGIISRSGFLRASSPPSQLIKFSKIGFKNITDGSSNTLMFGEKSLAADLYTSPEHPTERGGIFAGGFSTVRLALSGGPYPDSITSDSPSYKKFAQAQSFGSAHPGVFNCVFGDGSVRSVSMDIDSFTFYKIGHRADGLPIDLDAF
jgi:prepilin-type processing-associated H-X9-DG protein